VPSTRNTESLKKNVPVTEAGFVSLTSRPDTLTLTVYTAIRQAIIDGSLVADSRVTESGLADQLQVSKTPVREALLRLKEVGLIEADGPRVGRIVSPSRTRTRDAYEVRESLESTSALLAAERGSAEWIQLAERAAQESLDAARGHDIRAYRIADEAFHGAVAEAGGNRRLVRLIEDVNALVSALRQRDIPGVDASVVCGEQHLAVIDAIKSGDPAKAAALMLEHVRHVAHEVLAHFDGAQSPGLTQPASPRRREGSHR